MHVSLPTTNPGQVLINAIVGRKTSDIEVLNKLIGKWIDTVITTDGKGTLTDEQKPVAINYARNYFEAAKLLSTQTDKPTSLDGNITAKLDTALKALTKEVKFATCHEIFNQAIGKLPHASHAELAESLESLVKIFSNEYDKSEQTISLASFQEELAKTDDVAKYFKDNLSKLNGDDCDLLEKHITTINDITLLNPGIQLAQKLSEKEIQAFTQAAKSSACKDENNYTPDKVAEQFKVLGPQIQAIINEAKSLSKVSSGFSLVSFYGAKLKALGIPSSIMGQILTTIQTHHKPGDAKANNESQDFIGNIAKELMESVPYVAIQAIIGFCSSLLHYIPFVGGTAATILQNGAQIVVNRSMAHAMKDGKQAAPAKANAE